MCNPKNLTVSLRRNRDFTYYVEVETHKMTRRVYHESLSAARTYMGKVRAEGAL